MTTQSPHLYSRATTRQRDGATPGTPAGRAAGSHEAQTRLPWWALALPAAAFATLLALLSGGSAHASTGSAAPAGLGHLAGALGALGALIHHLL